MACRFEITLDGRDARHLPAARRGLDEADRLEAELTIFRDTSEISRVNRLAGGEPVCVDAELFDFLRLCRELHQRTEGAFDITSTPLSRCWGFLKREGRLPQPDEIEDARACVGMNAVDLDATHRTVHFRRDGLQLNLGSIGKGYGLDRMVGVMTGLGVDHALLSAGGSSVLAIGGRQRGWTIDLRPRQIAHARAARLHLRSGALGTSGAGEQFVTVHGRRYGHVIDPRTGWPADVLAKKGMPPVRHYVEWREMLDNKEIEAIITAVPLWAHAEVASGCLAAGKHVLCEKMMAWDVAGCERMLQAEATSGRLLEIGYQRTYNPVYRSAYEGIITRGVLGDIYHARLVWHRNANWRRTGQPPSPDYDPSRWGYPTYEHLLNWRLYWRYGTKATLILLNERDAYLYEEGKAAPTTLEASGKDAGAVVDASETRPTTAATRSPAPAAAQRVSPSRLGISGFCAAIRTRAPLACGSHRAVESARACIRGNEAIDKKTRLSV